MRDPRTPDPAVTDVVVRLFASHAAAAGAPAMTVRVPGVPTVRALRVALPDLLGRHARHALVAVNAAYAGDDVIIAPGDDVALIPPVAGG